MTVFRTPAPPLDSRFRGNDGGGRMGGWLCGGMTEGDGEGQMAVWAGMTDSDKP